MRIIAGKYRRRILLTNPGLVTRPITDRAKESLFENIEKRLIGQRIADIFAGTGTMGFESLSRGAQTVTFIERDKIAVELLRQNVANLQVEEATVVWPADVFRCSFRPKGEKAETFSPFGVIFFDPPFPMIAALKTGTPLWLAMRRLARDDVSVPDATMILRVPERAEFDLPEEWQVEWTLKVSNMWIHVCRKQSASNASEPEPEAVT